MPRDQVEALEFGVYFPRGLPNELDEHRLEQLLQPHRIIHCRIDREDPPSRRRSERLLRQRLIAPLLWFLSPEELHVDWKDSLARRVGVSVDFKNLARLNEVYESANVAAFWNDLERPQGQPVRLGKEFISRSKVDTAVYEHFRVKIDELKRRLTDKGVWSEVAKNTSKEDAIDIVFGSRDILMLDHAVMRLDKIIEFDKVDVEYFVDTIFSDAAMPQLREWLTSRARMTAAGTLPQACVRVNYVDRSIWVLGERAAREEAFQSFARLVATICREVDVLGRVVLVNVGDICSRSTTTQRSTTRWLTVQPATKGLDRHISQRTGVQSTIAAPHGDANGVLKAWRGAWLADAELNPHSKGVRECGVCMMQADEPIVDFIQCGHSFCLECIQSGVTSTSRLPL